jgi:hypothetical protein
MTGSAPRGAIPNWLPAQTIEDYVANCREGLERYSDSRAAELLGWSRIQVWRAKLMAELPEELLDRLIENGILSSKALANVALALRGGHNAPVDIERCPHCSGVLRVRAHVGGKALEAISTWIDSAAEDRR